MTEFTGNQVAVRGVFGFFGIFICCISVMFLPLWVKRRKLQPLAARPFSISIASQAVLIFYTLHTCLQRINSHSWPCVLTVSLSYTPLFAAVNLYMLRTWLLWFSYNETEDKNIAYRANTMKIKTLWYLNHKRYTSNKFLAIMFWSIFSVEAIAFNSVLIYNPDIYDETTDSCPSINGVRWFFVFVSAIYAVICVIAATKFSKVHDGFYLKHELRGCGIVVIISLPLWVVFSNLSISHKVFPFSTLIVSLTIIVVISLSMIYPLRKSYWVLKKRRRGKHGKSRKSGKSRKRSRSRKRSGSYGSNASSPARSRASTTMSRTRSLDPKTDLEGILNTEEGEKQFRRHLMEEFSVENLLFYKDAEQFYDDYDNDPNQTETVRALLEKYIYEDSPLQVNIAAHTVADIVENFENNNITKDIFSAGKAAVLKLMAHDSFKRFDFQYGSDSEEY